MSENLKNFQVIIYPNSVYKYQVKFYEEKNSDN